MGGCDVGNGGLGDAGREASGGVFFGGGLCLDSRTGRVVGVLKMLERIDAWVFLISLTKRVHTTPRAEIKSQGRRRLIHSLKNVLPSMSAINKKKATGIHPYAMQTPCHEREQKKKHF